MGDGSEVMVGEIFRSGCIVMMGFTSISCAVFVMMYG
jgi:hypothetical protein